MAQKSYCGKVKMIYIAPPYNTGNDFIYPDDFKDSIGNYLKLTGQASTSGQRLTTNAETGRAVPLQLAEHDVPAVVHGAQFV